MQSPHRPGARSARRERCHSILPRTGGAFTMGLSKQRPLRVELLEDRSLPSAAFVYDWNNLVIEFQGQRAQGNQQTARALAMMNAAIYDSVNAVNPTHTAYHTDASAFPGVAGASADAAAAQAA